MGEEVRPDKIDRGGEIHVSDRALAGFAALEEEEVHRRVKFLPRLWRFRHSTTLSVSADVMCLGEVQRESTQSRMDGCRLASVGTHFYGQALVRLVGSRPVSRRLGAGRLNPPHVCHVDFYFLFLASNLDSSPANPG